MITIASGDSGAAAAAVRQVTGVGKACSAASTVNISVRTVSAAAAAAATRPFHHRR